jgi:hypothetical protein
MNKLILIFFLTTAILLATESEIDEEIIKNLDFFIVMETVETDEILDEEFDVEVFSDDVETDEYNGDYSGGYNG